MTPASAFQRLREMADDEDAETRAEMLYLIAAAQGDERLRKAIEAELHHAEDNGHLITEGQGIDGPVPGVKVANIRAALDREADRG